MFGTPTCPNFQDKMPHPSHIVKKHRPPHHPLPPGLSPHLEDQELLPLTKANLRHCWHRFFPWHCKGCFNRLNSIRIIWIQFGSPLKYQGNLGKFTFLDTIRGTQRPFHTNYKSDVNSEEGINLAYPNPGSPKRCSEETPRL